MPGSYVAEPQGKRGGKDICVDACVGGIVICGSDIVKFCKKGGFLYDCRTDKKIACELL